MESNLGGSKEGGWEGVGIREEEFGRGKEGQNGKSQQVHQLRRGAASQVGGDLSYRVPLSPNLPQRTILDQSTKLKKKERNLSNGTGISVTEFATKPF